MGNGYTHIAVILDRTGSMEAIRDDTIGGFNSFLRKQKAEPGKATLTLVQFDTEDPYEVVHRLKPISKIPKLTAETYVPRAATPLYDAIGRGINDLEMSLAKMKKDSRPSQVVFVIVTDGQENSSREFNKPRVQMMIKEKSKKEKWQFVFLCADLEAFDDAVSVGIHVSSSMMFVKNKVGTAHAWDALSDRTADYRAARSKSVDFDESDRIHPDDPGKKGKK